MVITDLCLIFLELAFSIGLYFLAGYAEKVKSTKWKLLYVLPLIVCILFIAFTGEEISLLPVYIAVIVLLVGFSNEDAGARRIASAVATLLIIPSIIICNIYPGYRSPNYHKEFEEAFASMKEHYCLTEHKGIDWDALYEEYEPRFKEVQKKHDEVENFILWSEFCYNFHDGHVAYTSADDAVMEKAGDIMYGNDYGLSLMTLADGTTVAVNVEKESEIAEAGIKNGTVITSWDGKTIDELINEKEIFFFMIPYNPVKENDDFYRAVLASGIGGDTVCIGFIADDGKEHTVNAPKLGAYMDRLDSTMHILTDGIEATNATWFDLDEDTAILRLNMMIYDSESASTGDYSSFKETLRAEMLSRKEQGIENLIIDMRNNGGGDPGFIRAIAELLAPEGEHPYAFSGVWDDDKKEFMYDETAGKYAVGKEVTYKGENVWGDGQIVLLVSSGTISAGDHFAKMMSIYDNVTIIGFTSTNCSGQAIRGVELEAGALQFSSVPTLNEDGSIYIDADMSRQATVPLDIKVPFDKEAVEAMFENGEDYLLDYARKYIDGK